jgi:hypothetical protein
MIKGTKLVWKDNPRWPIGDAKETIKFQAIGSPYLQGPAAPRRGRRLLDPIRAVAGTFRAACASFAACLAALLRQAGARLFARNDEEAGWHGWQITGLHGGLARGYRDTRFSVLHLIRDIDSSAQAPDDCPLNGDR